MIAFACGVALISTPGIAASITVRGTDAGASKEAIEKCSGDNPSFKMSAEAFLAVVRVKSRRVGFCGIFYVDFTGDIDAESIASLRKVTDAIFTRLDGKLLSLELDSVGGDVWESLSFARFIRQRNFTAVVMLVRSDSRCYSSCVFLLAGGFQRVVEGEVGIHRPYFTDARIHEAGYRSMQQAYDGLYVELKTFLTSVNVSDRLVSDMWLVPSSKLRVLTAEELQQYGLTENDSVFTELQNAQLRSTCGDDAPRNRDDYWNNAYQSCKYDHGKMDLNCLQATTRRHPFCRCLASIYPNSNYTCD
jgi:hypothetical protein